MTRPMTSAGLEQEIGALADLPRPDLVERWKALYRSDPPKGISRPLLVRAVAYEMQAKRFGSLKPATFRRLQKIARQDAAGDKANSPAPPRLKSGARLIREWNGVTHVVDAIDDGFIWQGARYGSLSAIARAITGARWSGPRFFGLASEGGP